MSGINALSIMGLFAGLGGISVGHSMSKNLVGDDSNLSLNRKIARVVGFIGILGWGMRVYNPKTSLKDKIFFSVSQLLCMGGVFINYFYIEDDEIEKTREVKEKEALVKSDILKLKILPVVSLVFLAIQLIFSKENLKELPRDLGILNNCLLSFSVCASFTSTLLYESKYLRRN